LADIVTVAKWLSLSENTTEVQNAIDLASTTSHKVKLEPNRVYLVGTLTPKENVELDLNGSTIKLKNGTGSAGTETPLFYDTSVKGTHYKNFIVKNGILDGNNANNQAGNTSGGIMWLRNWDNIHFENLKITKAFRIIFNILGCENISLKNINCVDNGLNVGGFYGYGASFEQSSKNIVIDNFKIDTMYGYGIHFYTAENVKANNLEFTNLTKGGLAIGITITEASRIELNNVKMLNVDGDNFEVNNSNTVSVDNMEITNAGVRSVLFGNMSNGINSNNVKITNMKLVNSGNTYAMALNYVDNLTFENCTIDKIISTMPGTPSSNINFIDCIMPFNLDASFLYNRFNHANTQFNDITINYRDRTLCEISTVQQTIAVGAVYNLNLGAFLGPKPTWAGELTVLSQFTGSTNQGTLTKYLLYLSNGTMVMSELHSLDGSLARKVAVTLNTTSKYVIFTNSTGVEVSLRFTLKCV
jgi:hypothetical protein